MAVPTLTGCGTPPADVAAKVDNQTITNAELKATQPEFEFLSSLSGGKCAATISGVELRNDSSDCARLTLSILIQEAVVRPYAQQKGIVPTEADITKWIATVEGQLGGEQQLKDKLSAAHVTMDSLRSLVGGLLLLQNVQDSMGEDLTEDQLRQLYEQQKGQFTKIDTAHILVEGKGLAEQIKAEATPKNFAELAKRYSTDTGSASKGGELGSFAASDLVPEYSNAALAAKPGQIIGPVQSQFGWHVIWVHKIQSQPFDQVKSQLQSGASGQNFQTWMGTQMSSAHITVNPLYGRMDLQLGLVVPVNSTAASPGGSEAPSAGPPSAETPSPAAPSP